MVVCLTSQPPRVTCPPVVRTAVPCVEPSAVELRRAARQYQAHRVIIAGAMHSLVARELAFWLALAGKHVTLLEARLGSSASAAVAAHFASVARAWSIPWDESSFMRGVSVHDKSGVLGQRTEGRIEVAHFADVDWVVRSARSSLHIEQAGEVAELARQLGACSFVLITSTAAASASPPAVPVGSVARAAMDSRQLRHAERLRAAEEDFVIRARRLGLNARTVRLPLVLPSLRLAHPAGIARYLPLASLRERGVRTQGAPGLKTAALLCPPGAALDIVPLDVVTLDLLRLGAEHEHADGVVVLSATRGVRLGAVLSLVAKHAGLPDTTPTDGAWSERGRAQSPLMRRLRHLAPFLLPQEGSWRTEGLGPSIVQEAHLDLALEARDVSQPSRTWAAAMSDGARICVYEWGRIDAPVLLLINALGMTITLVESLAQYLAATYRVIVCQSRDVPAVDELESDEALKFDRQTRDVAEVLEGLGAGEVDVVGWCTGAQLALELASTHPERVRRLVLLNGTFAYDQGRLSAWQRRLRSILGRVQGRRESCHQFCEMIYGVENEQALGAGAARYASLTSTRDAVVGYATSAPFRSPETLFRYSRVALDSFRRTECVRWSELPRSLVVAGALDDVVNLEAARWASAKARGAVLIELPEGTHYQHYEAPERTGSLLVEFLRHGELRSAVK